MPTACKSRMAIVILLMLLCTIAGPEVEQAAVAPEHALYRPTVIPDRIVLSWTADPARSQAVTWRTDTTVANAVAQITVAAPGPQLEQHAQTVAAVTTRLATDLWPADYHSATFQPLQPHTLYAYRVGDGTHWSEWLQFRTASDQPRPFSFLYFGDVQNAIRPLWSRVLREAFRAAPDAKFLAFGGDLVNHGTSDAEWGELFGAGGWLYGMVPMLPTPGNHEYYKDEAGRRHVTKHWRAQFALPQNGPAGLEEYTYYLDYQGTRIVSLNPNEMLAEQTGWLDKVLSHNPNRWTIVEFHQPIFSPAKGRDNSEERAAWKPVFDRHGVDLVLTGHDHTYARSGLEGRAVYVVSVSGAKMYDLERKPWMRRVAEDTQLFQVITIAGDTLSYEARTATGELYDAFELHKRADGTNALIEDIPSGVPERLRQ